MPSFLHDGHRLAYTELGDPDCPRTTVLLHGLLLSQKMHMPLARTLADRGNRVITIDLLGHGESDRPVDMLSYSMSQWGEQVIGLLDHLGTDQAVLVGTSLGANVALESAALAPARLRGMVIEMPVLDNALLACTIAFAPVMLATTFGLPVTRPITRALAALPRWGLPFWGEVILDWVSQDPAPSGAVLRGLVFGRVAPPRSVRRRLETQALVIGHRSDPVHAFSDADMLVDELPHGRLVEASSIIELRLAPERLTREISGFIDECWRPRAAAPARRPAASG
ncbi:MAG TPA: alpha/beta hydrolase [Solirubrobacteraceae bacterium]|nr:alpha/beta hydrolase [Solirubrobacteraceae bacterium]